MALHPPSPPSCSTARPGDSLYFCCSFYFVQLALVTERQKSPHLSPRKKRSRVATGLVDGSGDTGVTHWRSSGKIKTRITKRTHKEKRPLLDVRPRKRRPGKGWVHFFASVQLDGKTSAIPVKPGKTRSASRLSSHIDFKLINSTILPLEIYIFFQ